MLYFCLPAQHFSPFCSSLAPRRWRSPSRRTWATKVKFCFKTLRLSGRRTFSLSQVSDKVEESKEMCSYNSLVGISCFNSVSTLKLWRGTFFIFCSGECDLCETRKDWWNALLSWLRSVQLGGYKGISNVLKWSVFLTASTTYLLHCNFSSALVESTPGNLTTLDQTPQSALTHFRRTM